MKNLTISFIKQAKATTRSKIKNLFIKFSDLLHPLLAFLFFPLAMQLDKFNYKVVHDFRFTGFGHWGQESELLVAKQMEKSYKFIILVDACRIPNSYIAKIVGSRFLIIKNFYLFNVLSFLYKYDFLKYLIGATPAPPGDRHYIINDRMQDKAKYALYGAKKQMELLYRYQKTYFKFPKKDIDKCRKMLLSTFGIEEDEWFVCVHAREDMEYHAPRSNKIETFFKAAEYIKSQGGYVIRVGESGIESLINDNIFDYPNSIIKSEIMDIFLLSNQKFLIGSNSGVSEVTNMFGVPVMCTNTISWILPRYKKSDIYLLKLIKNRETNKYISISEYMEQKMYHLNVSVNEYTMDEKYQIVDNSDEDILMATQEMFELIHLNRIPFDEKQQLEYKMKYPKHTLASMTKAYISPSFLNKYKSALYGS